MHFIDISSTMQFDGGRFSMILCVSSRFMSKVVSGASDHCLKDMLTVNNLGQWGHHLSLELNLYSLSIIKHSDGLCKRLLYKGKCDIDRGHPTLCMAT